MAQAGSAYKVRVPWSEVGAHSVAVMLHGAHVAGSPFGIKAITQARPAAVPPASAMMRTSFRNPSPCMLTGTIVRSPSGI